ncbi:MAG TPA: DMT family transporter [Candidatus Limnocylindria bacterium]|nr:DMT family transporter [Candidatus Limnocylindria bacterium]
MSHAVRPMPAAAGPSSRLFLRLRATNALGAGWVVAAALAFATLGSLSGVAYRSGMGSPTFVALRAVIGATALVALVALRHRSWVRIGGLPRQERVMLAAAMLANGTLNLALFAAYGEMAVALVLAVYFTYPMLVAVTSVLIGRERFTRARTAGLLLSACGVVLVLADQVGVARFSPIGMAWAVAAAACQATYLVVSRRGYTRVPAEQATALILGGGAILAGAVVLAVDLPAGRLLSWASDAAAWAAVLTAGLLGAAAAKVWLLRGVRQLGGTRTAVLMLLEPVAGVLLAAAVLGQAISPTEAVGGLVIIAAAVLVQRPAPGPAAPPTPVSS